MDGEGSGELEFEEFQKLFLLEPILLSLINSADISIAKVRFLTEILDDFRRFVDEIWRF